MEKSNSDMICFSSIELSEPEIKKNNASSHIILNKIEKTKSEFVLNLKYEKNLKTDYLPLFRLAFCMPLLNYGLFTKKIKLNVTRWEKKIIIYIF